MATTARRMLTAAFLAAGLAACGEPGAPPPPGEPTPSPPLEGERAPSPVPDVEPPEGDA